MFEFIQEWFDDKTLDLDGLSEEEVNQAIDLAVETVDPRFKLISGYRKKLYPAVVEALLHARKLIQEIPGSLEITRAAYASDPLVYSLFGSVEQLESVFGQDSAVKALKSKVREVGNDHCYALLLMTLHERRRPGVVLRGDMVQGDVMQEVVYFSDHKLAKVAISENDVRRDLRQRAFEQMLSEAMRQRIEHSRQVTGLKHERSRLTRELREAAGQNLTTEELLDHVDSPLSRTLADVEEQLTQMTSKYSELEDYLDMLLQVLTRPQEYCGLENRDIRLDRSGVKLSDEHQQRGHKVSFASIQTGDIRRAGIIVRYPFSELKEPDMPLDMAALYGL